MTAARDPALAATIASCTPLLYAEGADPKLDRPAHVRAGSSLARIGGRLVVIQDDANFLAVTDPASARVDSVSLPRGVRGARQFDDRRENKAAKLDLEAAAVVSRDGEEWLLAFGSGSTPARQSIALVRGWSLPAPHVTLVEAAALYAELRRTPDFAGSELNVEGAVFVDGRIRLFGRGNGRPRDGLRPVDATCDLDWLQLLSHLEDPEHVAPPRPSRIVQVHLGTLGGLRLGFTDATLGAGRVLFSAVAEASPDVTRDGPVTGSVLGVFDGAGRVRWTSVMDSHGELFDGKIEGLQLADVTRGRLHVVVDRDDCDRATELCEVELTGSWFDS
ncbi:MAG: hypothetical protein ABR576_12950 [Thermoanaerobaculia bacterium]